MGRRSSKEERQHAAEDAAKEKKSAPIKRHILLMSWNGRGFTRLVLRSYYDQRITLNECRAISARRSNTSPT